MSEQEVKAFNQAYVEWTAARAEQAKLNADTEDADSDAKDAAASANLDRVQQAEHQLAFTPAAQAAQFVSKFEALETMIADRERDGRPADHRHMIMVASVKADLYRFSLKPRSWPDGEA